MVSALLTVKYNHQWATCKNYFSTAMLKRIKGSGPHAHWGPGCSKGNLF
jgi:hypothetical protein